MTKCPTRARVFATKAAATAAPGYMASHCGRCGLFHRYRKPVTIKQVDRAEDYSRAVVIPPIHYHEGRDVFFEDLDAMMTEQVARVASRFGASDARRRLSRWRLIDDGDVFLNDTPAANAEGSRYSALVDDAGDMLVTVRR